MSKDGPDGVFELRQEARVVRDDTETKAKAEAATTTTRPSRGLPGIRSPISPIEMSPSTKRSRSEDEEHVAVSSSISSIGESLGRGYNAQPSVHTTPAPAIQFRERAPSGFIFPLMLVFTDANLNILRINDEAKDLLNYSETQLHACSLYDICSHHYKAMLQEIRDRIIQESSQGSSRTSRKIVSTIHPNLYKYAAPSALMMAAPLSSTYSTDLDLRKIDGLLLPYRIFGYRSGAYFGMDTDTFERQLYLSFMLVKRGYESRVRGGWSIMFHSSSTFVMTQSYSAICNL